MTNNALSHLAIIMDGNRRWAKQRLLPVFMGHKAGYDNVRNIISLASENSISHLTLWALSTENLVKRTPKELDDIISLIDKASELLPEFMQNNIRFQTIGDTDRLPEATQVILKNLTEQTTENTTLTLTLALVYGGQDEIIRGIQKVEKSGINVQSLTPERFREYLDVSILPLPDLIVRTGGDTRTSGFLLYDSPYSELYFTDTKWPDFGEKEFYKALESFGSSKRNFGK